MIRRNKDAEKQAIQDAIEICTEQAKEAAEAGQKYVILHYHLPNYSHKVMDEMEKLGVKCVAQGFGSRQNGDGSYTYQVECEIRG